MKNAVTGCRGVFPLVALALLLGVSGGVKAAAPDLTTVDLHTIDRFYSYNLGPTGMRGWIYHNGPVTPRQDATTAFSPGQILVPWRDSSNA